MDAHRRGLSGDERWRGRRVEGLAELSNELAGTRRTLASVLRQRAAEHGVDPAREPRGESLGARYVGVEVPEGLGHGRVGCERAPSREELEGDDPERVAVAGGRRGLPAR